MHRGLFSCEDRPLSFFSLKQVSPLPPFGCTRLTFLCFSRHFFKLGSIALRCPASCFGFLPDAPLFSGHLSCRLRAWSTFPFFSGTTGTYRRPRASFCHVFFRSFSSSFFYRNLPHFDASLYASMCMDILMVTGSFSQRCYLLLSLWISSSFVVVAELFSIFFLPLSFLPFRANSSPTSPLPTCIG